MTLSIVTICYQDLVGLKKTIESLRVQSSYEFEQWVIDGNSSDGTKEYLESLNVPWKLQWISEKDRGLYDAMNKGTARSNGDYVWFLNSGDICNDQNVIQDLLQFLKANSVSDIVYGKVWFESKYGRRPVGQSVDKNSFAVGMPISHQSILYRRELVKNQPYPIHYRIISDWIVTKTLVDAGAKMAFFDRFLAIYDTSGLSSANQWKGVKEKIRYEPSAINKAQILFWAGGKTWALWFTKKTGIYDLYKRLQHRS